MPYFYQTPIPRQCRRLFFRPRFVQVSSRMKYRFIKRLRRFVATTRPPMNARAKARHVRAFVAEQKQIYA